MTKKQKHQEEFSGEFGHLQPSVQQDQQAKGFKKLFEKKDNNEKKSEKKENKEEKK
ncbi:hypothetical protein ACE1TH_04265 [Shouchella sp. JSM 1781072]|uniref:hypothetical protein n=1 Tax=Bacillaceae TaxID=186817 RepID=UPI00159BEC59|nr:hypothetical protein [Bacillus sp. Marseille-P3800]